MKELDSGNRALIEELLSSGWLQSVDWFTEIDSTNLAARRALQTQPPSPALFVAERQTAGRGRSDHQWWSPSGCLMLTLAIPAELLPASPGDWGQLALVSGIAVAEACGRCVENLDCQLKWPNDVYVGKRKLAGILIESAGVSSSPHWLIGIGVNVAVDWSTAPDDLPQRASCLTRESGSIVQPGLVLIELMCRLESWIVEWGSGQRFWLDGWRDRCLLSGKRIRIRVPGRGAERDIEGRCQGLDSQGYLLLDTPDGLQAFPSAEVVAWE